MSGRRPTPVLTVCSDDRGVSEAISQGLIFMMVITAATGVGLGSEAVIDNTRNEASFDQAVTGFEQLDKIVRSYTTNGDQEAVLTASRQTVLYSRNAELFEPDPTTITIQDGGEEYTATSQPLQVQHDTYELTYDTGLLQSDRIGETRVLQSPNQSAGTKNMLSLITLSTKETFDGGEEQIVLVSEAEPTEIITVSDAATITVTTDQETSWTEYLEDEPYIESVSSTETGSQFEITAEFVQSTTVYNQQIEVEAADRFS